MTSKPRRGIPLALVWMSFPVLLTQGLRVRRTTLRLPEATGTAGLVGEGGDPLRLVVLGDSVAAGVGVGDNEHSVAGHLARRLAAARRRPVTWTVVAQGGLTAAGVRALVDPVALRDADVVVISVGVNDTKNLHSDRQWRTELGELLDAVLAAAPGAGVVLLGLPPLELFPALPAPLSHLLGARARRINVIGRAVAAERPRVRRLELEMVEMDGAFAEDGFHPSALLHGYFADGVMGLLAE